MPPAPSAPPPAAKPSAPAAPPAAPSTPKSAPPPKGATPEPPADRQENIDADWMKGPSDELDQMSEEENQPRKGPEKPKAPPIPEQKEEVVEEITQQEQLKPKPEDDDGVISQEDEQPPERPMRAPELRKAYEEQKKRIKEEFEPTIVKLQSRVKELEEAKPIEDTNGEKYKAIEARNTQLEQMIGFFDHSQSKAHQEGFVKPYEQAWEKCLADIAQLEVEVPDGQGGYTTRKALDTDVQSIAALPLGERIKKCNALFGDASPIVLEHCQQIIRLNDAMNRDLDAAKRTSSEQLKTRQVEQERQRVERVKLWSEANTQLATKYPRWFAPVQGDTEGNKLLDAGFAVTSLAFPDKPLTPEQKAMLPATFRRDIENNGQLSPENRVRLHALIRNKAANHDRLAAQLKKAQSELKAANQRLAEYEDSEPAVGGSRPRANGTGGHYTDDADAELEELGRKGV